MPPPQVSIIVPVYNVDKYLQKCLDSLVHQTLTDIEIIAVNDGSTDRSGDILEQYAREYPSLLKVITTPNHGVSHARNVGIDMARGQYILFVDSDDHVDLDMCLQLHNKAIRDNNDIVLCGRYDCYESSRVPIEKPGCGLPVHQNFCLWNQKAEMIHISPFSWDKLIQRNLLEEIRFVENIRFEDLAFVFSLLIRCKNIGVVFHPLYYYRRNNCDSFLNQTSESELDLLMAYEEVLRIYTKSDVFEHYRKELEFIFSRHIFYRYRSILKKNLSLRTKITIVNKTQNYMDSIFPEWRDSVYLMNSVMSDSKKMKPTFKSRIKTQIYIFIRHLYGLIKNNNNFAGDQKNGKTEKISD